jgi:hypothetical protein
MMDALWTTVVAMPAALARRRRSVCVVALREGNGEVGREAGVGAR